MSSKKTVPTKRPHRRRRSSVQRNIVFADLPELRAARALWQENKLLESCRAFQKIVELYPANIPALVDTSRALGKLFRYSEAEECLRRVLEVGERSGRAHLLAGQSYRLIRRPTEAVECLRKAIQIDGSLTDAHLELAIIYERRNELELAEQHAQSRLKLIPGDSEAGFLQGRLDRRRRRLDAAENALSKISGDRACHWLTRCRAFAELAATKEAKEDYAGAWSSMLEGKNLCRPRAGAQITKRNRVLPILLGLAGEAVAADIDQWQSSMCESVIPRNVLVTGIPRSGTTLLGMLLHAHPEICFADEFNVFPHVGFPLLLGDTPPEKLTFPFFNDLPIQKLELVRQSCRAMFASAVPACRNASVLLDKNPSLLPLLVPYIRVFPESKLLIMRRDPRDILISCLMTYMPLNDFSVDMLDLDDAVQRLEAEFGYWLELRPQLATDAWLELEYEKLVASPRAATAQVIRHLGLPLNSAATGDSSPDSCDVFSPSYSDVAQPVHLNSIGRWRRYADQLQPVADRLEILAATLGYES